MPAAAPISGVEVKVWPCSETRGAASGESRNAGSAEVVAVLRCEALGASMASGRVMPKSRSLTSTCSTVVIIVDPPRAAEREYRISFAGDYRRANAAPRALSTIRGVGEARCRLEVRELVVEDEAVVWDRDRAPSRLLDGEGVGNNVAPLVRDGEVRRRRPLYGSMPPGVLGSLQRVSP
jgi:hypothetical protein